MRTSGKEERLSNEGFGFLKQILDSIHERDEKAVVIGVRIDAQGSEIAPASETAALDVQPYTLKEKSLADRANKCFREFFNSIVKRNPGTASVDVELNLDGSRGILGWFPIENRPPKEKQ